MTFDNLHLHDDPADPEEDQTPADPTDHADSTDDPGPEEDGDASPEKGAKKSAKKKAAKTKAKKKTAKKTTKKKTAKKSTSRASKGGGKLLVVESPAKAKTIKKFLGANFTVKASMGHVRDIPSSGRGKKAFGIDFENGYEPTYAPIKGREKVLGELKKAAEKAEEVYLAPDPDREGEAIAWHLKEALMLPDDKTHRVTFNAITKRAVQEAMEHPDKINMNLVNAQQGRRVLDRLVGYSLSPFLWKKVTKGLSAGRVQSVAVRMVVEREKEIAAFVQEEFWRIQALVALEGASRVKDRFTARLARWKDKKYELGHADAANEEVAKAVVAALEASDFIVQKVEEKEVKGRPSPPFITSTLQQAASTALRFGAKKTMMIAQQLYEGIEVEGTQTGLITYMRTDSTRISPEGISEARTYIHGNYAPEYLPEKPQFYSSKKGAQDAHEAIRPTYVHMTPERLKPFLSGDQYKLYDLIWRRFVASQMMPARFQTTTATIHAAEGVLEAKGRRILFDGHTALTGDGGKKSKKKKEGDGEEGEAEEKDQILPELKGGDKLDCHELIPTQHFTQPPPRYSEASLVRALEKEGIGRPSTYAPIVSTIQDRGYVRLESRRFHATELGIAVTEILIKNFDQVMDLKFTATMEADLDHVEEGSVDWVKLIDDFYKPFEARLEDATENAESLKGRPAPGGEKCPQCDLPMVVRYSRGGAFLGCSGYPDCKTTMPMPGEENAGAGEDEEAPDCPACGASMSRKRSRFGEFYACSQYPDCKQTIPIGKDGQIKKLPDVKGTCEKCGKEMIVKMGRRGPFLACTGYPDCKNTKHISKDGKVIELPKVEGEVCEKCQSAMVVRMGRRGPFLACSGYPKCRNAKPLPKSVGGEGTKEEQAADKAAAKEAKAKADADAGAGAGEDAAEKGGRVEKKTVPTRAAAKTVGTGEAGAKGDDNGKALDGGEKPGPDEAPF